MHGWIKNSVNRRKRSTTWCTWVTSNFSAKNEKEWKTLIQTVRIYSQDIGIEFGIEQCAMLVMKSGKRHMTEGVELLNQVVIRTLRKKRNLQILGDIGSWYYQTSGNERKKLKRVSQKKQKITRDKTLQQDPCQRNKYLDCHPRKILGAILEVDQGRT